MTNLQKSEISRLRKAGVGYKRIADVLGLSKDTVKSYCQRNDLGGVADAYELQQLGLCGYCKRPLGESRQKTKRFCSKACRMAWWKANPDSLNRKAVYQIVCGHCHMPFESYGNKNRKYCSRACYAKAKAVERS